MRGRSFHSGLGGLGGGSEGSNFSSPPVSPLGESKSPSKWSALKHKIKRLSQSSDQY